MIMTRNLFLSFVFCVNVQNVIVDFINKLLQFGFILRLGIFKISIDITFALYQYFDDLQFRKEYDKPCDQLQMVTYSRRDILKDKNERLKLGWALQLDFMRDVYKEIRHIRDYDKKSLFSDISAIIGFICGFFNMAGSRYFKSHGNFNEEHDIFF